MKISDLKKEALEKLHGNWMKVILTTAVFIIVSALLSAAASYIMTVNGILGLLINIAIFVVEIPFSYGFTAMILKIYRREETSYLDFVTIGLNNIGRAWAVVFRTFLKLILPILAIFITAIAFGVASVLNGAYTLLFLVLMVVSYVYYFIKTIAISQTTYVAIDNKDLSAKESILESESMMKGNVWKYICIALSFLLWILLLVVIVIALSFAGPFALIPAFILVIVSAVILSAYFSFTYIAFYEDIKDTTVSYVANEEVAEEKAE